MYTQIHSFTSLLCYNSHPGPGKLAVCMYKILPSSFSDFCASRVYEGWNCACASVPSWLQINITCKPTYSIESHATKQFIGPPSFSERPVPSITFWLFYVLRTGLRMQLSWWSVCLGYTKPRAWSALYKLEMVTYSCYSSISWKLETGGSEVQDHVWLQNHLRPSWATQKHLNKAKQQTSPNLNFKPKELPSKLAESSTHLRFPSPQPVLILIQESWAQARHVNV